MKYSTTGYKDNSPDKNQSQNLIPGNLITMKGVSKKLMLVPIVNGKPQYDRKRIAKPGDSDIQFESDVESVLELPFAQSAGIPNLYVQNFLNQQNTVPQLATQLPTKVDYDALQKKFDAEQLANNFALPTTTPMNNTMEVGKGLNTAPELDANQAQQANASIITAQQTKKDQPFQGAINPYGGWNMENSATALGAFIEDKNLLGTIGSAGKLLLSGTRNALGGAAGMKRYNEAQDEYESKLEESERRAQRSWFQKGGRLSTGKMLTGNYIEGNEDHPNPNLEAEGKEFLQTPDGSTMQIIGKRHSEGGELLNMPGGTKVISDYLKIGAKLAQYFKKEYNLNVKTGSTFATVLTQYRKKIGLTKLLDEETVLLNKITDQEDVKFEGSREMNLQVLSGKVNELQPQKKELEQRFEVFTNLVFDKQEETKKPGQINYDDESKEPKKNHEQEEINEQHQEGGEVDQTTMTEEGQPVPQGEDPNQQQQGGGSEIEQLIMAYAQISGQDPAEIIAQLQQLPEDQLEAAVQQMESAVQEAMASQQGQDPSQMGEQPPMRNGGEIEYAQIGIKTKSEWDKYLTDYTWDPNFEYKNLEEEAKYIVPFLERNDIKYNPEDLKTQEGMDKLAGLAQQSFRTNFGGVSDHYSSLVAATQNGLQTALDNKLVSEKELTNLGVKILKGKVLRGSKRIVPQENEQKVVDLITANGAKSPEGYKKYVDANFVDNKWYFRNPNIQTVEFDTQKELDDYTKGFKTQIDNKGSKIYYSDKQGLYFIPTVKGNQIPSGIPPIGTTGEKPPQATKVDPTAGMTPPENKPAGYGNGLPMLLPDQSNLPPNLLQPGLRQMGHVQANAIRISPEETLKELNRQYSTASDSIISSNPYTAGAAQANLQAQANNSINQAYSQAAIVNAQDERNVANTNEQRIQQRDQYNIGQLDNYEKLSQIAQQNYYDEWRGFINNKNLQNVNNFNTQQQVNASNAVNPNYQVGAMGEIYQTNEKPYFYTTSQGKEMYLDPKTGESHEVTKTTDSEGKTKTTEKTKTTSGKKQKGGLVISKSIKKMLK